MNDPKTLKCLCRVSLMFALAMVLQSNAQTTHAQPTDRTVVDSSTLQGKLMVGYQGWFNCDGDGSGLGWKHWSRRSARPAPNNVTFDLWPDMSELDADERFPTDFEVADGEPAELFSSANAKTVDRHFQWMHDYGIDGAFVQRFANQLSNPTRKRNVNLVLNHARSAAENHGRAFAVMYDLSGLRAGQVARVREDWVTLVDEGVTGSDSYLHHRGKPLVAVWGVGFDDDRSYSLQECLELVRWLKREGYSIMLGVPSFWREGTRDATDDPMLHQIMRLADVISPWSVGRYRTPEQATQHAERIWGADLLWCQESKIDFLPVVFPGFSWHNLKGDELDSIPRLKGDFLRSQLDAAHDLGCTMLYVAMFDEVDEATAIFKCTSSPPVADKPQFLTYEGLPSDFYLQLTGAAARRLHASVNDKAVQP